MVSCFWSLYLIDWCFSFPFPFGLEKCWTVSLCNWMLNLFLFADFPVFSFFPFGFICTCDKLIIIFASMGVKFIFGLQLCCTMVMNLMILHPFSCYWQENNLRRLVGTGLLPFTHSCPFSTFPCFWLPPLVVSFVPGSLCILSGEFWILAPIVLVYYKYDENDAIIPIISFYCSIYCCPFYYNLIVCGCQQNVIHLLFWIVGYGLRIAVTG